ncbi:hypothetical protein KP509_23G053600 [Ceratopteris richardii]|uniref:Uncharacterized protein n=1 Tax=Ceratopteris richardii TaxID=49495 RepID=A0A8T2S0I6_CERRI|nr:hypothetical protein KP509_23G053600 [Ceratopteris richardii]
MGRAPCCDKVGLKKGNWTLEEDQKLTAYINEHGHGSWRALPKKAGLLRCGKSCRLRWTNYLRPDIKRGEFSASEEQKIIQLHALLGNKWSAIASHLPRRTDNEIKNYWNTHLKKRLIKMGIDPVTHKPQCSTLVSANNYRSSLVPASNASAGNLSAVNHMAQWESVRLETEARLAREAEMRAKGTWRPSSSVHYLTQQSRSPDVHDLSSKRTFASVANGSTGTGIQMQLNAASNGVFGELDFGKLRADISFMASCLVKNDNLTTFQQRMCSPYIAMSETELSNSLIKWEKTSQSNAGMAWSDSLKLKSSNNMNIAQGRDSSSCSSPSQASEHGSPTSTLSSLDLVSKQKPNYTDPSSQKVRRLCWHDNKPSNISTPLSAFEQAQSPPSADVILAAWYGAAGKGHSREGSPSPVPCLEEIMQCETLNDTSEGSLLIGSKSSDLLCDLELVSEGMSSSHHHHTSVDVDGGDDGHDICEISYSTLLAEDDYECEWTNILEEDVEAVSAALDDAEANEQLSFGCSMN